MKKLMLVFLVCLMPLSGQDSLYVKLHNQFVTHAVLETLDLATTLVLLNNGGVEGNPRIQPHVNNLKMLVGIKVVVVGVVYLSTQLWKHPDDKKYASWGMALSNLMYTGIVANNINVMGKLSVRDN